MCAGTALRKIPTGIQIIGSVCQVENDCGIKRNTFWWILLLYLSKKSKWEFLSFTSDHFLIYKWSITNQVPNEEIIAVTVKGHPTCVSQPNDAWPQCSILEPWCWDEGQISTHPRSPGSALGGWGGLPHTRSESLTFCGAFPPRSAGLSSVPAVTGEQEEQCIWWIITLLVMMSIYRSIIVLSCPDWFSYDQLIFCFLFLINWGNSSHKTIQ